MHFVYFCVDRVSCHPVTRDTHYGETASAENPLQRSRCPLHMRDDFDFIDASINGAMLIAIALANAALMIICR